MKHLHKFVFFHQSLHPLPLMACKEDHCRLLQDEDEYSGSDYGLVQRAQPQSLFYKRYAFISSGLLALSVILNAILIFPRHASFMAVSYHDRTKYGPLLNPVRSHFVVLTLLVSKSRSRYYSHMARRIRLLERQYDSYRRALESPQSRRRHSRRGPRVGGKQRSATK